MDLSALANPLAIGRPRTVAGELRSLVALAGPLVGANLMQLAIYSVDVMFVARLGTLDFAAATLGVFLLNLSLYALVGLTSASGALIAAAIGARAHAVRQVRRSFRMAAWIALAGSLAAMLPLWHGEALLLLAGQDAQVAARAGRFLRVLMLALPTGVLAAVMRTTAAALGRPGWAPGVTAAALAIDIAGNWCLVFGHLSFPALGLEGSALASVATNLAMLLAYGFIFRYDRRLRRYRLLGRWWRPHVARAGAILRLGAPTALAWVLEGALFGGAAILMGLFGVAEVAAHAVALNLAAVAFQLPLGVAQAATIRVGLAYGAGDRRWIGRAGWTAIALGTAVMALTALAFLAVPRSLAALFLDPAAPGNAAALLLAIRYLRIAAVFQLFDGAQTATAGVLRGLQDTRAPMLIALFGYWGIGFGTSLLLGFRLSWRGEGIWAGLAVGLATVALLLLGRWRAHLRAGPPPAP